MRKDKGGTIQFISDHLDGFNDAVAYIGIISVLLALPELAIPFVNQILIDNVLSGLNPEWAVPLLFFGTLFIVIKIVLRFLEGGAWKHRLMMSTSSTSEMFWHTLRLPVPFFHDKYTSDITNRIYYGTTIADKIIDNFILLILDVVTLVFYVYFMIRYSAVLSIFAIVHILSNIILLRAVHKKQVGANRASQKNTDQLQGLTASAIENIDAIKSSTSEPYYFQLWGEAFEGMQNSSVECTSRNVVSEVIPQLLDSVSRVIVLGIGAYYIMEGQLTVGMLMTFQTFMTNSMNPMKHFVANYQNMASIKAQTERMKEILDSECDVPDTLESVTDGATGKLSGNIELRNVTFGYDRNQPPIIENFNMVLPAGKSVAFVGSSGCGKSTIAKLISGLYKPWSGEILFDGRPQDQIDRDVFASSVAIVDQNIVMFEGDVSENVKLWDESIEDFAMVLSCHDAQIHEEIVVREGGYHARMESGGKNFSGGQRQRIELASAFAKEPTIMIMDEGTSALDAVTEVKVMDSIRAMGCSQIIIAHRLSTIRDCDEIIVMKDGKVLERGNHETLMAQKGYYSVLIDHK